MPEVGGGVDNRGRAGRLRRRPPGSFDSRRAYPPFIDLGHRRLVATTRPATWLPVTTSQMPEEQVDRAGDSPPECVDHQHSEDADPSWRRQRTLELTGQDRGQHSAQDDRKHAVRETREDERPQRFGHIRQAGGRNPDQRDHDRRDDGRDRPTEIVHHTHGAQEWSNQSERGETEDKRPVQILDVLDASVSHGLFA